MLFLLYLIFLAIYGFAVINGNEVSIKGIGNGLNEVYLLYIMQHFKYTHACHTAIGMNVWIVNNHYIRTRKVGDKNQTKIFPIIKNIMLTL